MNLCFYIGYGAKKKCDEIRVRMLEEAVMFDRSHHTFELCGASDRALHGLADFVAKASDGTAPAVLITELIELIDEARIREVATCLLPLLRAGKRVSIFAEVSPSLVLPFVREILRFLEKEGYTGDVLEVK
jgi:hypothetical protein